MIDLGRGATLGADEEFAIIGLAEGDKSDVLVQLVDGGSWNGTITFEANLDLVPTWVAILAVPVTTGTGATTTTAAGLFRINASGCRQIRVRCSTYAAGSMNVTASVAVDR